MAGDEEEDDAGGDQDSNLGPEGGDGHIAPEDFGESVDGPAIDGEEAGGLHGFGHEIAGEHAAADGGHGHDDDGRERAELSTRAADAGEEHAECGDSEGCAEAHDDEAWDVVGQIDAIDEPAEDEHGGELSEGEEDGKGHFAGKQSAHGDAGGEDAVEGAGFGFVEEGASGAAGGPEEEHDAEGRGVEGDHGVGLVFADDSAGVDLDHASSAGGRGSVSVGGVGHIFAHCGHLGIDALLLLGSEATDVSAGEVHALLSHGGWHGGHGGFLEKAIHHLRGDYVAGVVEELDLRGGLCGTKGDGMEAVARGDDEGDGDIACLDCGFSGGGGVVGGSWVFFRRLRSGGDLQ